MTIEELQKANNVVSVVTIVLNDVDNIESTILSIISQVGCAIEYIVIDGGSTDGTLDIINKYRDSIHYLSSDRDNGIYYAMNKGVEAATGEWMVFINAGDAFFNNSVLNSVMCQVSADDDVIYGQFIVKYGSGVTRRALPQRIDDMWKGTITSHQAMLIRTDLMKAHRFDCDFRLAADHELVSKLFHHGCHFHYAPEVIAVVSAAGVSDTRRPNVYREYAKIAGRYFKRKPFRIFFFLKCLDSFFRRLVKNVMPTHIIERLQTRNRNII